MITGPRSGVTIVVVIDSTVLGPALGGCRITSYPTWNDGLDDAVRLAAAMSEKAALSGLHHGGGKTVAVLPGDGPLPADRRVDLLHDIGDLVQAQQGRYWTGPDVGTSPDDMAVIAAGTHRVFCRPRHLGGSGDSSGPTATGTLAALDHLRRRVLAGRGWDTIAVTVLGLGRVGSRIAAALAGRGARLTVSDVAADRQDLAARLGARWSPPEEALTAPADILVPAATGGLLTAAVVDRLSCRVIAGPANNQLDDPATGDLLHARGILWAPDTVVSAGGVVYATAVEIDHLPHDDAVHRVHQIAGRLDDVLTAAQQHDLSPAAAARQLARRRLRGSAAGEQGAGQRTRIH